MTKIIATFILPCSRLNGLEMRGHKGNVELTLYCDGIVCRRCRGKKIIISNEQYQEIMQSLDDFPFEKLILLEESHQDFIDLQKK